MFSGRVLIILGICISLVIVGVFGLNFTYPDIIYATQTHPQFPNKTSECPDGYLPKRNNVFGNWTDGNSPGGNFYEPFPQPDYFVNLEYNVTYKYCAEIFDAPIAKKKTIFFSASTPLTSTWPPTCSESSCVTHATLISPSGLVYHMVESDINFTAYFEVGVWKIHIQAMDDPTYTYRWLFGVNP